MTTIQSIIDRVTFVNKDPTFTRWTLAEILVWIQDAIDQMAEVHPRCASQYVTLTLRAGARQDLRLIDPTKRWVRLMEILCNVVDGEPVGDTVRMIPRNVLDAGAPQWRSKPKTSTVLEYAMDEREAFTFDVNPPANAGTAVYALAAVKPPPFVDEDSDFPLADGYDIPAADYVLFRCFSKDAGDASYAARATAHLQAYSLAMGVATRDAGTAQ